MAGTARGSAAGRRGRFWFRGAAALLVCAATTTVAATAAGSTTVGARASAPTLRLDSAVGPVTGHEIASFKAYIATLSPAPDNLGNAWAQGHAGEDVKAMGVVYDISHDRAVLDRMIGFCDAVLSERDDLAPSPVGHHVLWTGGTGPAWPNTATGHALPTGGEQGDPVGHLASCARLILQTPALWHTRVAIGDPHHYGATYLARARTFLAQADDAVDHHILSRLLDLSHGDRQYFAADSPYKGGLPVPWNQQMMFDYAFQNLAIAHQLAGDAPQRVARYDKLVRVSVDWFFSSAHAYTDRTGHRAYTWNYAPLTPGVEDNDHGSLDVAGLYRAYLTGRYGITAAMMTPLANTFVDVMTKSPHHYAGRVDGRDGVGNSAPTSYIRSGWLLASEFRPDSYRQMIATDFPGGTTGAIDQFARALLLKSRRHA